MKKKTNYRPIRLGNMIAGIFIFIAVLLFVLEGVSRVSAVTEQESLRLLQDRIYRSAITCYAIESRYPDSIAYLKENYHLSVDEEKYIVYYEAFAANIMPEITVRRR